MDKSKRPHVTFPTFLKGEKKTNCHLFAVIPPVPWNSFGLQFTNYLGPEVLF